METTFTASFEEPEYDASDSDDSFVFDNETLQPENTDSFNAVIDE